jgi:hypothetical protein
MNPKLLPGMKRRLTKVPQNKTVRFFRPQATHVLDMPRMFATRLMPSTWFKTRVAAETKTAWRRWFRGADG